MSETRFWKYGNFLIRKFDTLDPGHDMTGLTVDVVNNLLYCISFCDSTTIWKYSLTDGSYQGSITLNPAITNNGIQGIEYKNGILYISSDGTFSTPANGVHLYNTDGTKIGDVITAADAGEIEGLYVEGTDLYLNIAGTIYKYLAGLT